MPKGKIIIIRTKICIIAVPVTCITITKWWKIVNWFAFVQFMCFCTVWSVYRRQVNKFKTNKNKSDSFN